MDPSKKYSKTTIITVGATLSMHLKNKGLSLTYSKLNDTIQLFCQ